MKPFNHTKSYLIWQNDAHYFSFAVDVMSKHNPLSKSCS